VIGAVSSVDVDGHLIGADDVIDLLDELAAQGVDSCVGGGWGVDALLGDQTRPHGDLDLWIPAISFEYAVVAFIRAGVDRLYPWGDDRPWNFVLHDAARRRVDLHLYKLAADGSFHYGGVESGETFPVEALSGRGVINGRAVRCESAAWSLRWHAGYTPRPEDRHDMALLCTRFGFDLPAELE
jgi:lincosamide nucleotidyltransferase A/C/D/E